MNIRYVSSDKDQATNRALANVAERARAEGIELAGTVQSQIPGTAQAKCEIVLNLLPDGPTRNISLDLGPGVTGCRLDPGALEEAVVIVQERLARAQGLIVNKFGKQEAAGRGLAQLIGQALAEGKPVLVGVSPDWLGAFLAFADGAARPINADADEVMAWLRTAVGLVASDHYPAVRPCPHPDRT